MFFSSPATNRGEGVGKAGPLRKKDFFETREKNSEKNVTTKLEGEG